MSDRREELIGEVAVLLAPYKNSHETLLLSGAGIFQHQNGFVIGPHELLKMHHDLLVTLYRAAVLVSDIENSE